MRRKTRVPRRWSQEELVTAIEATRRDPAAVISRSGDKVRFELLVDDVLMCVHETLIDGEATFLERLPGHGPGRHLDRRVRPCPPPRPRLGGVA